MKILQKKLEAVEIQLARFKLHQALLGFKDDSECWIAGINTPEIFMLPTKIFKLKISSETGINLLYPCNVETCEALSAYDNAVQFDRNGPITVLYEPNSKSKYYLKPFPREIAATQFFRKVLYEKINIYSRTRGLSYEDASQFYSEIIQLASESMEKFPEIWI